MSLLANELEDHCVLIQCVYELDGQWLYKAMDQ